jgi:hypothetical protein
MGTAASKFTVDRFGETVDARRYFSATLGCERGQYAVLQDSINLIWRKFEDSKKAAWLFCLKEVAQSAVA